ncbi:uncharacterized protein LOC143043446 [Mytilus galloprovincialis]|uniref:uncharacterized protein LOC143043446 n=1 Tax=Mytilus galloprovincialis TaxID=29158 RepID=UPI003F7BB8FE
MHGFMNFDVGQCRPCSRGFYGINCLSRCHCYMNEKCDHVKGCLKVLHSTTEAVTEHDHVEGTTFSAVEPTTDTHSKRGIDDSKLPILSIIGISTVLILLVFVSLICVCWKYKVPCKKRKLEEGPSNTETSIMHAEENQVYFLNQNG